MKMATQILLGGVKLLLSKVLFDKEQTSGQISRLFSVFFEPLTPIQDALLHSDSNVLPTKYRWGGNGVIRALDITRSLPLCQ